MIGSNGIYEVDHRKKPDEDSLPRIERIPKCVLAVDPGGAHVGVAVWKRGNADAYAKEVDAEDWLPLFDLICPHVDLVVVEAFVLYPGKAAAQSWSPMATSEMIGAMKWIARGHGTEVMSQGADVKNPCRRQCKARGLQWRQRSGHASDATLHLYYWLLRHEIDLT